MDCLNNLQNCKAECCKGIVFGIKGPVSQDKMNYFHMHGCKLFRKNRDEYLVRVPVKCLMLDENNKCRVHGTETKPKLCNAFKEGNTSGYYVPEGCLLNKKEVNNGN